jgi:dihydroorotate dehydrogenase
MHHLTLQSLKWARHLKLTKLFATIPPLPCKVMGLHFPNPLGLAAGFDKNGDYIDAIAMLGFGFIEIGTITPHPQDGNPTPRLFRLTRQKAIINRMGFNNKGVEYFEKRLQQVDYSGILGINIGKNKTTPLEKSIDDYLIGFRQLWKFASYITINISSPNTPKLRQLQHGNLLKELLFNLKKEQHTVFIEKKKYVPLVVKISPDLSHAQIQDLAHVLLQQKIDGVIATNTTLDHSHLANAPLTTEIGGLSGSPLQVRSTKVINQLHALLQNKIPIIASGGIMNENAVAEKIQAGASLFQIYTGLIYQGPSIIKKIAHFMQSHSTVTDFARLRG